MTAEAARHERARVKARALIKLLESILATLPTEDGRDMGIARHYLEAVERELR